MSFSGGIEAEDEAGLVPRPLLFANGSIVGVLLAYVPDGTPEHAGLGLLPRSVGDRIQSQLLALLEAGEIRPIVKRVAPVEALPEELERMERRETIGRSVLEW